MMILPFVLNVICDKYGKRTEWSPIRSEIVRVINRIGRHEVLLPINHNRKKKPLGQTSPVETVSKVNNPLS